MNNIQKHFKRKAQASGRCLADGFVPSAGEARLLAQFDERMGNALGTSTGGVTDPNAAMRKAGDMKLTQQTYAATNDIEDQRDQLGTTAQTDMTKRANEQLDGIRRMSGLSSRQRATAAMGVAGDAAKMGVSLDTSGLIGSGLSARQQVGMMGQQFDNQTAITHYDTNLQNRALDRQKMGLAQGLDVNRKKLGMFADGKVPVHSGPGIVEGPGGPREDKVPAMLSDDEAVLPAKTVQALGGPDAVAELIEQTNGKPPKTGLRDGGRFATGVIGDQIDPRELRPEFRSQAQTAVIEPAANPGLEAARNGRAAQAAVGLPNGGPYVPTPPTPTNLVGDAPAPKPGYLEQVRANLRSPNVGSAVADAAGAVRDSRVGQAVVNTGLKAGKFVAKGVAPLAAASDAAGVVDVATDDGMSKVDVATEVARNAGRWGAAGVGAKTGVALAAPVAPLAGPAAPLVLGAAGLAGGAAAYFGADKLMNLGAGETAPSERSFGAVKKTLGMANPNAGAEAAKPEDQYADARAANAKILASGKNTPGRVDIPDFGNKAALKDSGNQARGLAVAKQFFPDGGMPEDIRVSRQNETNAPMAVWNSKNDAAAKTIGSLKDGTYIQPQDGTGIVSIRQKDGSFKNVALGKSEYQGVDGKTTSDYSKSARYQQGLRDAAGQRQQLENFQRMNAESDMKSNDPNAQMNGLITTMGLRATDAQRAAAAAKNAITPYQKWQMEVQASQEARANRQEAATNARDARDFRAKDGKDNRESYDRELEIMSGGDKAVHADLLRYASGYKDDPNAKGAENAQSKLAYVEARKWLNEKGQHALSFEKGDDGRSVPDFRKDSHRFWDYARGILGNEVYEDRRTGQRFSASTIDNAPEHVKKAFYDHLTMNAADRAAKQKAQ